MRAGSLAARTALVLAGAVLALALSEVAARVVDGQPLTALRLPPPRPESGRWIAALDPETGGGPLGDDVDPLWLAEPPPRPDKAPIDPVLLARAEAAAARDVEPFEVFRVWNRRFAERFGCEARASLRRLPAPLLTFDPPDGEAQPPYRYRPSSTLPGGLVTNRYGFRGPDVPLDKPVATIRLAFVGASTTAGLYNLPASYPEYVLDWLNRWAQRDGLPVRFDGVNAGREGLGSGSIAAVVRQEILPLEPDLVIYYEGANQSLCTGDRPPGLAAPPGAGLRQRLQGLLAPWQGWSQLARRANGVVANLGVGDGREPEKPPIAIGWPAGADAPVPDLDAADLPPKERAILADLETLRRDVAAAGGELALSSFAWMVSDGLQLDPRRDAVIHRHLNSECWPYRYADVRRAADLHNRLLAAFAARHDLPFIDVAALLPPDPALFYDAFHLKADGTRLHAWIVFRALLPLIRERLASGAWPRPDRAPLATHPAFAPPGELTLPCQAPG